MPDYPSGHASTGGAMWAMLAYLFPREGNAFHSKAEECATSRLWAGIHVRSACYTGLALGRSVASRVIERASAQGA